MTRINSHMTKAEILAMPDRDDWQKPFWATSFVVLPGAISKDEPDFRHQTLCAFIWTKPLCKATSGSDIIDFRVEKEVRLDTLRRSRLPQIYFDDPVLVGIDLSRLTIYGGKWIPAEFLVMAGPPPTHAEVWPK